MMMMQIMMMMIQIREHYQVIFSIIVIFKLCMIQYTVKIVICWRIN